MSERDSRRSTDLAARGFHQASTPYYAARTHTHEVGDRPVAMRSAPLVVGALVSRLPSPDRRRAPSETQSSNQVVDQASPLRPPVIWPRFVPARMPGQSAGAGVAPITIEVTTPTVRHGPDRTRARPRSGPNLSHADRPGRSRTGRTASHRQRRPDRPRTCACSSAVRTVSSRSCARSPKRSLARGRARDKSERGHRDGGPGA